MANEVKKTIWFLGKIAPIKSWRKSLRILALNPSLQYNKNGKVYDCFTFFNELDLLEIRLNVLNEAVDYFVIVEANRTHTGKEKPFYFEENQQRYQKFLDKIIYIKVEDLPEFDSSNTWVLENYQRVAIVRGLLEAKPNDVIIISDLDEIPNPEMIRKYRNTKGIKVFYQKMYYYFINYFCYTNPLWQYGTRMGTLEELQNNNEDAHSEYVQKEHYGTPQHFRFSSGFIVEKGGWHFSYLGGVEAIIKKIENTSHQELNIPEFKGRETILKKIAGGMDLYDRGFKYKAVSLDKSFPNYIRDNISKYPLFIYESDFEKDK